MNGKVIMMNGIIQVDDYEPKTIEDLQAEDSIWEDTDFYLKKKNRKNKRDKR